MNKRTVGLQKEIINPWVLSALSTLFLLSPFFFSTFPPSTDLPQHLSQLYLLRETLEGNSDLFSINWFGPNNLIYLLLAGTESLFAPPLAGKMALIILVLLWIGSILFLAWNRRRPPENTILAALLIYNFALYWGFLNFLIGWPLFVIWLVQSLKPMDKRNWFILLILSILLYSSHILWFLVSSILLIIHAILHWKNWKSFLYQLSPLVLMGAVAIIWYPSLYLAREAGGFDTSAFWSKTPLERISLGYLTNSLLGGIKGYLELMVLFAILVWISLALYTNRRQLKRKIDSPLLMCSLFFSVIMLFAPEQYMNTAFFSQRWFPCAIILLILALPAPAANRNLLRVCVICILLMFSAKTARNWYLFQQKELSGLQDSLRMLPEDQRVLGLDFVKRSDFLKGRPFLETFAYAQVFKGGNLNFSFAEHASGIVQYKSPKKIYWTRALEWNAQRVTYRDFQFFDYALINGDITTHSWALSFELLEPLTEKGRWRLYKIKE